MLKAADKKALKALIESAAEHFNELPTADSLRDEGGITEAREKVDEKSEKWSENEDNQNKVEYLEQLEGEIENYESAFDSLSSAIDTIKQLI